MAARRFTPIVRLMIGDEEIERVVSVLRSGIIAHGPVVEEFEERFAEYVGVDYAVAVSNGTVALDLILKAYGIGPGDEVITTPFSFIATSNAILFQGARPVWADIDPETFNIDPDRVVEKITSRTKAIIAVHLYGHPADMDALREIAEDHKLLLIEDAAQAHGAEYKGKKTGSLGDAAAFSFYATKNMTTGEGGMITTNDRSIAERVRLLRNHGQAEKYLHTVLGYNYRMTSIQAALGLAQLEKLDSMNAARRENASILTSLLSGVPGIRTPVERPWAKHVYHQYVVRILSPPSPSRDTVARRLADLGVGTAVHYPRIIPDQPLYQDLGYKCDDCVNARRAASQVLSLPVHPGLTRDEVERVARSLVEALGVE